MPRCGTTNGYRKGCRCPECERAVRDYMREYTARVKERDGLTPTEKIRGVAPTVDCTQCGKVMHRPRTETPTCKPCRQRAKRAVYVPAKVRLSIYDRDEWTCQICSEPVEPGLPSSSPWQATLDHIVPRSKGGSDEVGNLRLAHRYCNAVRSNRDALTIEELVA